MATKRAPRAAAKISVPPASMSTALAEASSSPDTSPGTTLVQALEHIPPTLPKIETSSNDSQTPPPAEVDQVIRHHVDEHATAPSKRKRASAKTTTYAETSEPEEAEERMEEKPASDRKKAVKKAVKGEEAETAHAHMSEPEEAEKEVEEKPKKGRKKAVKKVDSADEDGQAEMTPKKKRATPKKTVAEDGDEDAEKPKKKVTPKKSRLAKDEPEHDSEGNEIIKKKRKPKEYPKIEYEIPPVERKETTFRGRLGYACLNTVLRSTKPDSIFCSRTCRIASIEEEGMELPKGLALMNARDLLTMIEWNEQNKIRFMRLSSEMFPFASHAKYGYNLEFADKELNEAGELARKYGHRLTLHPGQFTQLGSPKDGVVEASIRELDYQCEILDRMGMGPDGVMIIHMGGIYGDKPSTLARFKENYIKLKDKVKKRLVLENDEICYNVDDIFPVCDELDIPIIFDYHHDWIFPSSEPPSVLIPKIAEIWKRRGIKMKQHLSEPRPGAESVMEKRAHADRCQNLPKDLPDDVDLMLEAKDKEQAVFELYRLYGLEEVIDENLRPPDAAPGLRTKGRKSALKKKVKETGEVDSDGNPIELFDVEKDGDDEMGDESMAELKEETQHKRSRKAKITDGIATEGNEIEAKLKPKRSRKSATKKVTAEMIEATGPTNGDEAEGSTAKPEEAPVEMPKKASRTMAKKAAEQVMEGIDAKAGEEAGGSTAKLEETSTVKPKKARKSMTKKVAEEVVEGIDAKAGEEANAPLEKMLVDKPKKPRKSATKQVVEEVMEEIEAEMKTETEEVERMEGTEAVRAPQKKRSTAAQLA